LKKLAGAEMVQHISALALEALGPYSRPDQSHSLSRATDQEPIGPFYAATPMASYLSKRAISIYGGAREVQKDIIAKSALGL
jgi:alkylation response protein AidB-like acyl-CoA dehydrogenase